MNFGRFRLYFRTKFTQSFAGGLNYVNDSSSLLYEGKVSSTASETGQPVYESCTGYKDRSSRLKQSSRTFNQELGIERIDTSW